MLDSISLFELVVLCSTVFQTKLSDEESEQELAPKLRHRVKNKMLLVGFTGFLFPKTGGFIFSCLEKLEKNRQHPPPAFRMVRSTLQLNPSLLQEVQVAVEGASAWQLSCSPSAQAEEVAVGALQEVLRNWP